MQKEVDNIWSESNSSSSVLPSNVSASILSDEVVQDEEIVESSTHSIRIVESLLVVTPPVSPKVYEISNISFSHAVDPEEDIQTSIVEEKLSFHPTQSFSSDSSILNFV